MEDNPAQNSIPRQVWIFTAVWLLVNVLQSTFTELAHDEAYYWMYARKMDIGYYDHPPMIAAMIKSGGWLFNGELGVRLLVAITSAFLIPVMYLLSGKRDFTLLAAVLCASTVFQVYGFIAVPDAPLIFFTALFFLVYRNYVANDNLRNALLVALVIALLLYSKYHGLLVVFFTVLSNLKLLTRKSFYLIIILVTGFYLPHIFWQINNDYPSYQYHVLNKSQTPYNPLDSLEFLGGTLLVAGPLIGLFLVYAIWKYRSTDPTIRAMRFTFFGFVIFFLFSTLNSAIEANWMAASVVPLVIVAHHYIHCREKVRMWVIRLSIVSLVIFSFARINLMTDIVPALGSRILPEFYGWNEWTQNVKAHADGCPVVIMNSYQRASKYSFYADTEALSLNNIAYRKNQYDLWDIVDKMQGKRIALFRNWSQGQDSMETFETPLGKVQVIFIDDFFSFTKVRIETDKDWYTFPHSSDVELTLTFHYPQEANPQLKSEALPVSLVYSRYYFTEPDGEYHLMNMDSVNISDGWKTTVRIRTPDKPGPYYLRFGLKSGWLPHYINSHLIRMDIE